MDLLLIFFVGVLVAINSSIVGTFLVLRKMSMLADAISHGVLPGIVIGYLLSNSREGFSMYLFALLAAVVCVFLIELFRKFTKVQTDAAIGITFTTMFALGVILISSFSNAVDLDQDCVLYGELVYVPLDSINIGAYPVPYALIIQLIVLLILTLYVLVGYKQLQTLAFDQSFANISGMKVNGWHVSLMILTSLVTITSFEAVGAILVIAFMIVPPSTALFFSKSIKGTILLSAMFASISVAMGLAFSYQYGGSITGAMSAASGLVFIVIWLISSLTQKKQTLKLQNQTLRV